VAASEIIIAPRLNSIRADVGQKSSLTRVISKQGYKKKSKYRTKIDKKKHLERNKEREREREKEKCT
jgi:methylphosphotriester-DNA--protein-cysteine methyltransferase